MSFVKKKKKKNEYDLNIHNSIIILSVDSITNYVLKSTTN